MKLTELSVDGPIADYMGWLVDMTISMLIKFASVIVISPTFLIPGIFISVLGAWCGQIYIKAQLAVKREMSNARSPVLGHFGAAVAGLSKSLIWRSVVIWELTGNSIHPCIRSAGSFQTGIVQADR